MKEEKDNKTIDAQPTAEVIELPSRQGGAEAGAEAASQAADSQKAAPQPESMLDKIKQQANEDDDTSVGVQTLRQILGGDILSAQMVRSQIWLLLLIVLFIVVGVAFRYQCQQDTITISQLEDKLVDAKYRALSASSKLTEQCRESRVLDALKANQNDELKISKQPPYIINVEHE